ncbi:hypothetical protein pb186bvf_010578 [Paramecium bursaria]
MDCYSDDIDQYLILDEPKDSSTIIHKHIKKKQNKGSYIKDRDYRKNICRNIVRMAIKSMRRESHLEYLGQYLNTDLEQFIELFQQQLCSFSGFRALKQRLLNQQTLFDQVFAKYLVWFLQNRASLFILNGEASQRSEYLRYKNEIMLFYAQIPHLWNSNKKY